VRQNAAQLWVIEKNPKKGDAGEKEADELLPRADVVAITGSSLTNHTLMRLLELCNPAAYVILLGGTAPLSPVLFAHGIDAVCGTKVTNPRLALRCISEGANFRQIEGLSRLTMRKDE
jgi:hypothetical protein